MHDWYDWLKDIGLPSLVGLESIGVGAVAVVVARQSHELAKQVRRDEAKRDAEAALARYRDQLFQVTVPAVVAVIDYTNEVNTDHAVDTPQLRKLRSAAASRLRLMRSVATGRDRQIADAAAFCLRDITKHPLWQVQAYASSGLAGHIASVLAQDRDDRQVLASIRASIKGGVDAYEATEQRYRGDEVDE